MAVSASRRKQRRCPHALDERVGHAQVAHLLALALHEDRPRRIERRKRAPERRLEGSSATAAAHRGARPAPSRDGPPGPPGPAPARRRGPSASSSRLLPEPVAPQTTWKEKARGQSLEVRHDLPAEGLVAAFEAPRVPAHLAQHVRERARAPAAAPAVHERLPVARLGGEQRLDVPRDVARRPAGRRCAWPRRPTAACRRCPRARARRRRAPAC